MDQKTYDVGMKMRRQVAGDEYVDKAMANLDDFNRDFQRIVTQYCWGEAWGDDTLPPRTWVWNSSMRPRQAIMPRLRSERSRGFSVSSPQASPQQYWVTMR